MLLQQKFFKKKKKKKLETDLLSMNYQNFRVSSTLPKKTPSFEIYLIKERKRENNIKSTAMPRFQQIISFLQFVQQLFNLFI